LKQTYALLRFGCLPAGFLLIWLGWVLPLSSGRVSAPLALIKSINLLAGALTSLIGACVIHNVYFSRNGSEINPNVFLETWAITHDRLHNSNVDLIWYQNAFYLVHAASLFHFGTADSKLLVKRSIDGVTWEQVAVLGHDQDDIRDPKLAVIGNKLFLYVLLNRETHPLPYTTRVSWTDDGIHWSDLASIGHEGWLLWRPKTRDEKIWYVPAYWHKFHHNALFTTDDGLHFEMIASISKGRFINEPEIEFMPDGCLLASGRGDYLKGSFHQIIGIPQTSTVISVASPPYTDWQETAETQLTRLDGPVMFSHHNRIYAVGRAHPYFDTLFPKRGAVLAKKRTAIFLVAPSGLIHITDLPSCGDTAYAGVVLRDGCVYIAYYTNNIKRDFIWLFGMLEKTEIRMVKITLNNLERAVEIVQAAETTLKSI
jgi:hypothetical protein